MGKLDGRVAAITGGTAGIGRGIAEAFLAEGASVALNGRNKEKGERVLAELGVGGRAIFIAGDVMNNDETDSFIDQTQEHFGNLDILVNNAGGAAALLPTVEMPFEGWAMTFQWNLHSIFVATKRALPAMIEQGGAGSSTSRPSRARSASRSSRPMSRRSTRSTVLPRR